MVHLRGVFTCTTNGAEVFKLPEGYRPASRRLLLLAAACLEGCRDSPDGNSERADIAFIGGAGDLTGLGGAVRGSGTVISLDGVSFRAEGKRFSGGLPPRTRERRTPPPRADQQRPRSQPGAPPCARRRAPGWSA